MGELGDDKPMPRRERKVERSTRPTGPDDHGEHCGHCGAGLGQYHHWGATWRSARVAANSFYVGQRLRVWCQLSPP